VTVHEAYDQLSSDYAASGDLGFTTQHVVDAYIAQYATEETKPISVFFALVGLCLRVEKRFSGRTVQHIHRLLARRKQDWPMIEPPRPGPSMSALDVIAEPFGLERDEAVDRWCESVWELYCPSHDMIRREMRNRGIDV